MKLTLPSIPQDWFQDWGEIIKTLQLIVYRFISVFGENFENNENPSGHWRSGIQFQQEENGKNGVEEHYPYRKVENDEFPKLRGTVSMPKPTPKKRN